MPAPSSAITHLVQRADPLARLQELRSESPPTRESTSSSSSVPFARPPRSVLPVVAEAFASSTRTGSTRTVSTSTSRSSLSTPPTRLSVAMLASTGSATPSTSAARLAVLPPLERRCARFLTSHPRFAILPFASIARHRRPSHGFGDASRPNHRPPPPQSRRSCQPNTC